MGEVNIGLLPARYAAIRQVSFLLSGHGTPQLIRRESGANPLSFFMNLHKFARDPRLKDVAFSATFLLEIQVVRRGQPTSRKRVALETYEIIMAGNALVVRFACLARRRHPGLSGAGGRRLSGIRREILS